MGGTYRHLSDPGGIYLEKCGNVHVKGATFPIAPLSIGATVPEASVELPGDGVSSSAIAIAQGHAWVGCRFIVKTIGEQTPDERQGAPTGEPLAELGVFFEIRHVEMGAYGNSSEGDSSDESRWRVGRASFRRGCSSGGSRRRGRRTGAGGSDGTPAHSWIFMAGWNVVRFASSTRKMKLS